MVVGLLLKDKRCHVQLDTQGDLGFKVHEPFHIFHICAKEVAKWPNMAHFIIKGTPVDTKSSIYINLLN